MKTGFEILTGLSFDWAIRCFGKEHVTNGAVRGLRHVEEAVELAQALGNTKDDVIKVISIVYDRPIGEVYDEIGGSLLTLVVLCESHGIDPQEALEHELKRVLNKPIKHFADRNAEKVNPSHG